jgi:hypothetical protein
LPRDTRTQVVQLPQSIAFRGNETAAHDAAAIAALPRGMLTLMVRAADSLAYARRRYGSNVDVLPAPDVAWSLGALMPGSDGPVADVLVLLRADHEAAPAEAAVLAAAAARGHAHAAAAVEDAKPRNNTPAASTRAHAAHAALAQLRASGHTYELRDWGFAGANLTRELSQVRAACVRGAVLQQACLRGLLQLRACALPGPAARATASAPLRCPAAVLAVPRCRRAAHAAVLAMPC